MCGRFTEAINLLTSVKVHNYPARGCYIFEVIECIQLWAEATMYTQELFVHDGGER